jgi:hypothetical protein
MRRVASLLPPILLGLLVFAAWMHPAVLWPGNAGWLLAGDDRGQAALGLAAFLRAGDGWLHQPLLSGPEGMALLFTDSIPLLGVLLAPLAGVLPPGLQFVGAWYLACALSQAAFAWALVRRYVPDAAAAWAGAALLAAFPAFLNRYGHASLCAQWLILAALWLHLDLRRAERPLAWAALLAVAALIHAYLLLMVAAIGGSTLLARLAQPGRARPLAAAALALLPAVVLMAGNGAFGGYGSTGTYGQFPAALDAWWNPANPDYAALLPSSPALPQGRGFEGFNYLGAGLLALVLLAGWQIATGRLDAERRALLRRLAWLLPALAVLALVAIGPAPVWRGQPLFALILPQPIVDALDPVRAGGRLLWPASYALAFAAVACAGQWRRSLLVLGGALALQVADLMPMLSAVRHASARADDPRLYHRTPDPRWTALVANARAVQFEPAEPFRDLQLMEEIGWRAVVACRPLTFFYASREARSTRARIDRDSAAFRSGRLDPTRLYVLFGDAPAPAGVRVRTLDGVRIVPPSRPAGPPICS